MIFQKVNYDILMTLKHKTIALSINNLYFCTIMIA